MTRQPQGNPAAIFIRQQPAPTGIRAGEEISTPKIEVHDAGGNLIITATPILAYIIDSRMRGKRARIKSLSGGVWTEDAVSIGVTGSAVPLIRVDRPGEGYRLKFAYNPGGTELFSATTDEFQVSVGRCSALTVVSQPGGALLGQPFARPVIVEMQDSVGNGVVQDLSPITIYISDRDGKNHRSDSTLTGCPTTVKPVDGVATFIGCQIQCNIASQCAGANFELQFSGPCEGSLMTVWSSTFTMSEPSNEIRFRTGTVAAAATTLAAQASVPFTLQPIVETWTMPCGAVAQSECLVSVQDPGASVTAYIDGGFSNVLGTTTVAVVNGVATFTDLAIQDARVAPYTLTFNRTASSSGTVLATISTSVTVSTGAAVSIVITSQPSLTAPGDAFGCVAELRDLANDVVLDAEEQVSVTIEFADDFGLVKPPTLKTSNSLTQLSASGVVTWTGLSVDAAPVAYTFRLSATLASGALVTTVSERIALAVGSLGEIRFRTQPSDVESGSAMPDIIVHLYDSGGNLLRGSSVATTVVLTVQTGAGTIGGTTTVTSGSTIGIATFTGITVTYASGKNSHQFLASSGGVTATTNPFFVNAAPASLVLRSEPTPAPQVGIVFPVQPQVVVRDGQANRARSASSCTVTVSGGASDANLAGTKTVACSAGIASFTDLSCSVSGDYTLTFSTDLGGFTVDSSTISAAAGPTQVIRVQANYEPAGSGTATGGRVLPVQPRIELLDLGFGPASDAAGSIVEARIGQYPAGRTFGDLHTLYGSTTAVVGADGVARFTDLAINIVGTYKLTFKLGSSIAVDSAAFDVVQGPIAMIKYVTQPGDGLFGQPLSIQPSVSLMDLGGNAVKGSPWLHIQLRSGEGELSGCDRAFAPADTGTVQFAGCTISGGSSGERTLVVQTVEQGNILTGVITGNEILSLISEPFIVSGPPSSIILTTPASGARRGIPFTVQPVVTILDSSGHLVAYTPDSTVAVAWHNPDAPTPQTLSGTAFSVQASRGVATFDALSLFPVGPGGLAFWLNTSSSAEVENDSFSGTCSANMTNTSSGLQCCASLGNVTGVPFCPASNFTVTQEIVVTPSPPSSITFSPVPNATIPAGHPITSSPLVVTLLDLDDSPSPLDETVAFNITSDTCMQGTCLIGQLEVMPLPPGHTASFPSNISIRAAGTYNLTIFAGPFSTMPFEITVVPAEVSQLVLLQDLPPAVFASEPFNPAPSVRVIDLYGNTVVDFTYQVTISITLSPIPNPILLGMASVGATAGVASFPGVSLPLGGSGFQITFASQGITTTSRIFTVSYPHTFLELASPPPATAQSGAPFPAPSGGSSGLTIFLNDDSGLRTLASSEPVTVSVAGGTSDTAGSLTVNAVEGVAVFADLALLKAGSHRLIFTSTNGVRPVTLTTGPITITPGAPARLLLEREPGGLLEGGEAFPVQPVVLVADLGGNLVNISKHITASILTSPAASAQLVGTISAQSSGSFGDPIPTTSSGVLTFSGLGITTAASGYVVRFSSPGLIPVDTAPLEIIVGAAKRLTVITHPEGVYSGLTFAVQPVVAVQDMGYNLVTQGRYPITAAVSKFAVHSSLMSAVGLYGGTLVDSLNGYATFSTLFLKHASFFATLRFTSPGFEFAESRAFSVGPTAPLSSCPGAGGSIALCGPDLNKIAVLSPEAAPGFSTARALVPLQPLTVSFYDWDGNLQVTATGNVTATITSGTGAAGAVLTGGNVEMVGGVAVFSDLVIDKASDVPYTFTVVYSTLRSTSPQVTVGAGVAETLSLGALPIQIQANAPIPNAIATLRDGGGNIANDTVCDTISLVIVSGPASFSSSNSSQSTAGSYLVTATMNVPGLYTIACNCTVAGLSSPLSSPSQPVFVLPYGPPVGVAFATQPGPVSIYSETGLATTVYEMSAFPRIRLVDSADNTIMGFVGFFRATVNTAASTTGFNLGEGDALTFWAENGMATLTGLYVTLNSGIDPDGTMSINVGSSCCSLLADTENNPSEAFVLTAEPTQLDVALSVTSPINSGDAFTVTVQVLPALAGGAPVAAYSANVECVLKDSPAGTVSTSIVGTLIQPAVAGVATFDSLSITTPGTYTIECTAPRPGYSAASLTQATPAITAVTGPARGLKFLTQPAACLGGTSCATQPTVALVDGAGNTVASAGTTVTLSLSTNQAFPGPARRHGGMEAVLAGTVTADTDAAGEATIPDMSISYAGSGYRVVASAAGLETASSDHLEVQVGAVERATIVRDASGLTASVAYVYQPVLSVSDPGGNWISGTSEIILANTVINCVDSSDSNCAAIGNETAMSSNGIAKFTDLGVKYAGEIQLRFKIRRISSCVYSGSCFTQGSLLNVIPGQAAQMAIVTNISVSVCAGASLAAVIVEVQDAAGNPVQNGVTYSISASLLPGSPLLGTTMLATSGAQATFTGLRVNRACGIITPKDPHSACYRLFFRSEPGGLNVTSTAFTILATEAKYLDFLDSPVHSSVGNPIGRPSVRLVDRLGNPIGQGSSCGAFEAISTADVTPFSAEEQVLSNVVVIGGEFKNGSMNETVEFEGASVNWDLPTCPRGGGMCTAPRLADLTKIRLRATGRYNGYSADSAAFTVDVAQPSNSRVSSTNGTHVVLTWNGPYHGPPPTAYRVTYKPLLSPESSPVVDLQNIQATTITIGPLLPNTLYTFALCSQSILYPPACSPFPPAPQIAGAIEPVPSLEVWFVTATSAGLRWPAPAGIPPAAYKVTIQTEGSLETMVGNSDVVGWRNITVPGLNSNLTYAFRVYPLSPAAGAAFYAPTSPTPPDITPVSAPTAATISCFGPPPCTGTDVQVTWTPGPGPNEALSHRVTASQMLGDTSVFSDSYTILASDSFQVVDFTGLVRGVALTVAIEARSPVRTSYYAPSASFNIVPTSPPSAPTGLVFAVQNNTIVVATWQPPADSGDGTPGGVYIDAYKVEYTNDAGGLVGFVEVSAADPTALSRAISGLSSGSVYTIRVSARGLPSPGEKCLRGVCTPVSLPSEFGPSVSGTVLFGSEPLWVEGAAPPRQEIPQKFNLFVGTRFEYPLSAIGIDAGQAITISAAGLSACGAQLVDVVVGNPATATLRMDPSLSEMDKSFVICFTATDALGAFSEPRCLKLFVAQPSPSFVAPLQTQEFVGTLGCPITVEFVAQDVTTAGVSVQEADARGYKLSIAFVSASATSAYGTVERYVLPEGSSISGEDGVFSNPQTRTLTWTPVRGQEAFDYAFCVSVQDSLKTLTTASGSLSGPYCVSMTVQRCSYCLLPGDSLHSLSIEWETNWLDLWAGNPGILNPSIPQAGTPVGLGPTLLTSVHDTLSGIAAKMGVTEAQILAWNPDLALAVSLEGSVGLQQDKEMCILPSTCVR